MISGSLDRRFPGIESCGYAVQLFNELILAKLLQFPGLLLDPGRDLVGFGADLSQLPFLSPWLSDRATGCFSDEFGRVSLFSRLGCKEQHRCRTGQAADQQADQNVLRIIDAVRLFFDVVLALVVVRVLFRILFSILHLLR